MCRMPRYVLDLHACTHTDLGLCVCACVCVQVASFELLDSLRSEAVDILVPPTPTPTPTNTQQIPAAAGAADSNDSKVLTSVGGVPVTASLS